MPFVSVAAAGNVAAVKGRESHAEETQTRRTVGLSRA